MKTETPRTDELSRIVQNQNWGFRDMQILAGQLERELAETHACLINREKSLAAEGQRWVKAMTERDAAIAALTDWRYGHDEIEAACGGDTALLMRAQVTARRVQIDLELAKRTAEPANEKAEPCATK